VNKEINGSINQLMELEMPLGLGFYFCFLNREIILHGACEMTNAVLSCQFVVLLLASTWH
jgi:hypothetical protein